MLSPGIFTTILYMSPMSQIGPCARLPSLLCPAAQPATCPSASGKGQQAKVRLFTLKGWLSRQRHRWIASSQGPGWPAVHKGSH